MRFDVSLVNRRRSSRRRGTALILASATLSAMAPRALAAQALSITPTRPEPGALVRLTLRADSVESITGSMAGEPLHFLSAGTGVWHAVGPVPVDASGRVSAHVTLRTAGGATDTLVASVSVPPVPRRRAEPLKVDTGFTAPPDPALTARIARENERARDVGRHAHDVPPLWSAAFLRPRASRITSMFGSGRLFNGALTSRHLGVDFAGKTGEPVRAANRGVVALVDSFFLAGNVIYIDHGGGIVTGYFHLSKQLVAVGDTVRRGQLIGLVGGTGRVTGPHLHWAARYGATTVNPLSLVGLGAGWYSRAPTRKK